MGFTEQIKVDPIEDTNLVKIEMVISKGKFIAMVRALDEDQNPTPTSIDLREMLHRAIKGE